MKKLIINADDFGFNREITDGIVECHQNGTVKSTTLMVNMPAADYAASLIPHHRGLSVGIHLNLTLGRPVSPLEQVRSLVNEEGYFHDQSVMFKRAFRFQLNAKEIERELTAQVERFLAYGVSPTHADSHHHVADCPQIYPVKARVLKKFGIRRIRTQRGWYHCDRSVGGVSALLGAVGTNLRRAPARLYYELLHLHSRACGFSLPDQRFGFQKVVLDRSRQTAGHLDREGFETMIRNCPHGVSECVVHPGLLSEDPLDRPEYRIQRKAEHSLLTHPDCLSICRRHGVILTNFLELKKSGDAANEVKGSG
jgi:predicted glycoside hydrolase/deacetylase ChbG (UPF0249 family)